MTRCICCCPLQEGASSLKEELTSMAFELLMRVEAQRARSAEIEEKEQDIEALADELHRKREALKLEKQAYDQEAHAMASLQRQMDNEFPAFRKA